MGSYVLIPHVADVRLKAEGRTLQELFQASLDGMNDLLKNKFCQRGHKLLLFQPIKISSPDATSLLIDFLSEVLTLSYENKALFCQVKFDKLTVMRLEATVFGAKVDRFNRDIKGVTYHEAEVKKIDDYYQTIIVFDI